ncbi:MAG TPA: TonB-dependent receptor [Bryobacteraceae bacterium]
MPDTNRSLTVAARKTFVSGRRVLVLVSIVFFPLFGAEQHGLVKFGGLPLPGATVTASQGEKKLAAITDQQGLYSFAELPDGVWTIQIDMLCFVPIKQDVQMAAGAPALEWEMKLLPLDELKAAAGPVKTATPASTQTATAKPSAFKRTDLNSSASNPPTSNPSAEAPETDAVNDLSQKAADGFLINGTVNNGASSPFSLAPAFGNNRRGPRSLYSGGIGLMLDNSVLDARSFSLTGQDTPKPAYTHLQGTVSFGGPIRIPRLIRNGPNFFVGYQWTRNRNASTQSTLMPTLLERNGDFSQTLNPLGKPVQIFDPNNGTPFIGNAIPQGRMSSQAKELLNFYPLPNLDGSARYNFQIPIVSALHQDALQTRLNKTIGRKNQVSGSFGYQSTRTDGPNVFGFLDTGDTAGINAAANWRHTFSPRLFGNLGFQFSRLSALATPYFANRANVSGDAGIKGNNQDPVNWGPPALNFAGGIAALSDGRPSSTHNQTSGVSYAILWNRARHNISFGGDFRRQQFNYLSQQNPRGDFTFTGASTQANVNGLPVAGTGSDFAGFLLGIPDTSSIAFGNADKYFRAAAYDAYVTDDWRMNPGFTLNAGVRWEYGAPITETYGRLVNLDVTHGFTATAPVVANKPMGALTGQAYPDSLIHPDKRGFQPRVAFSWRPLSASSMVVRGGYGVYYNTSVYQPIAIQMAQQFPLSKSLSVQNSPANPLTLANGFNASSASTPNTFAVDPNFRVGYSQNWQLSVQRDLPAALLLTAAYQGGKGTRGMQEFLPNTFPVGALNPCPACPAGFIYLTSNGNSTRESGQIQLRRRLHNGFTANLQYTFSKSIDDSALGGRGQGVNVIAQNWLDLAAERGLSNFDQRHQLMAQAQYTTGMGVGGGTLVSGWKGALFKEWTFVSQINAGSGLPLTPIYVAAVLGTGVTGSIRPDYTGAAVHAAPPGFFLNRAAYAAPATGQWGNAGRNSITGPAQFVLNAGMGRTFRVSDRLSADLRIDATNALNHVTYPNWNTIVTSAQFGLPNIANPMRSVETTFRLRF